MSKLTKDFLIKRYHKEKKTIKEIAKETGYSIAWISKTLKKMGLSKNINHEFIGKTFGNLTVINRENPNKHSHAKYRCLCQCGNYYTTLASSLRKHPNISCGCKSRLKGKNHNLYKGYEEINKGFWNSIVRGAKNRKLIFNITIKQAWQLYLKQNKLCAMTKLPIYFAPSRKKQKLQTASLDRIDSNKGYTIDNVHWVHKNINKMKQNLSIEKFIELCTLVTINA